MRRMRRPVGDTQELLLRPLRNIDVSKPEVAGMHQVRIFQDMTPGFKSTSGIHVLLVNQHQNGSIELKKHHPAWYTGKLHLDAIPIEFIDLEKLYYALCEAQNMDEALKKDKHDTDPLLVSEPVPEIKNA